MNIILSPHADDELIGLFEFLEKGMIDMVRYLEPMEQRRKKEAENLCIHYGIKVSFRSDLEGLEEYDRLFFTDPIYEVHPAHRKWGMEGEKLLRNGRDVIFYSVNMQAPYIHEVKNAKRKNMLLNRFYPSQRDLWINNSIYFLFEGYVKWLMGDKICQG